MMSSGANRPSRNDGLRLCLSSRNDGSACHRRRCRRSSPGRSSSPPPRITGSWGSPRRPRMIDIDGAQGVAGGHVLLPRLISAAMLAHLLDRRAGLAYIHPSACLTRSFAFRAITRGSPASAHPGGACPVPGDAGSGVPTEVEWRSGERLGRRPRGAHVGFSPRPPGRVP